MPSGQEKLILTTDNMVALCRKILLIDSAIISYSKLNKVCRTNMIDVHKACAILLEHGLISIESDLLANKIAYHESYLKLMPTSKSTLLDFTLALAKFGVVNIEQYCKTLAKGERSLCWVENQKRESINSFPGMISQWSYVESRAGARVKVIMSIVQREQR